MITLRVNAKPEEVIASLFAEDEEGYVTLGWSGRSVDEHVACDVMKDYVVFKDYLMETFVHYSIFLHATEGKTAISVRPTGANRDKYLRPHIKMHVINAGLSIGSIEDTQQNAPADPDMRRRRRT
jgi:hypothetical protein